MDSNSVSDFVTHSCRAKTENQTGVQHENPLSASNTTTDTDTGMDHGQGHKNSLAGHKNVEKDAGMDTDTNTDTDTVSQAKNRKKGAGHGHEHGHGLPG